MSLVTGLFFLVFLLNRRWSPPLRLQASHCSTFRIMCDVPSIAVFCSEYIECFPGTVSKFFLKFLVTITVAPVITGAIVHFRFHIPCISIHKRYYYYYYYYYYYTILQNSARNLLGTNLTRMLNSKENFLLLKLYKTNSSYLVAEYFDLTVPSVEDCGISRVFIRIYLKVKWQTLREKKERPTIYKHVEWYKCQ